MPVYNHATVPDYLAWAQNPMGLRTTLTYSPMTDPTAYEPGVNWRRYENSQKDSYPVIAASNYVVTQLEHRNEKSINSLSYALSLKKTYTNARMNTTGRGWQGFEKINTWNVTSGVLNTEKYLQAWPFTGTKTQIDTKSPDEAELLCSYRTSYETHERASGPWKIFQVHRTLEETNMYEKGIVARSNGVRYQYDKHGNMVLRSPFEQQNGKMVTQSYKRCQYTTIDGVTNVLEGEKLSSKESNVDMFRFEEGDLTLTRYDNETSRAVLAGILEWSSDIGSFLRKSIKFNSLGKEIEAVGTAGLKRTTTYDDVFQSFVVKVTQEGPGISTTEFTAYDEASGLEVALKKTDGDLSCLALDAFGRTYETRTSAAAQGPSTVSATDFLKGTNFVAHPSFSALLQTTDLNPQREVSFVRQKSQAGLSYLCSKIVTISHEGTSGRHEIIDFVDCAKQIRKRSSRNSDEPHKTWMAWEFDPRGQQIFESFPVLVPSSVDLNWEPDRRQGVNVTLDILGRPIARIRPAHADQDHLIKISNTYLDGGARIQERTMTSKTVGATTRGDADTVALIERRYLRIEDKDLVSESTDENGLTSKFEYNAFGALVQCTDPSGQVEQHFYNSLGDLVAVDNIYQNTARTSGSSGTTYRYNDKHELEEQTNAAGESIRFQRDSGGRLLQKLGDDGRIARFTYDTGSSEKILSITTYAHGLNQPPESSVHFTWDHRGRLSSRKLVLRENETFITSMVYDWQDRVIEKTLPDFSVVRSEYRGSQLIAHSISGGANSTWSLKAETMKFSGYGRPEEMKIQGSGMSNATHQWKFDSLGFPTSHTLSSDKSILVQESYFYNDLDQMTRKHELISATTVDYEYRGRRLAVSRRDGADASYEYDRVGNIVKNRDVTIEPTAGGLSGRRDNGQVAFNISYDGAGRLTQRTTPASSFAFTYDSFGSLQSMKNSKAALEVTFLSNFEGHTLERKLSDGTGDLFISNDYSIHYNADGSRTIHHKLFDSEESEGSAHLLGTVTTTHEFSSATRPLSKSLSTNFADTKGNVTHTFDADFRILGTVHYDDFGAPSRSTADGSDGVANATYEGKYLEAESGLILFGARWYDPLVGRFTAPDDIIDVKHLALPDGLNRYAFENNDPINHTDPTGHWSLSAIFGVVIAAVLVVAAIAITIATAGAATPLLGAVVGALASAGVAGITYSIKHQDDDAGVFWYVY